MFGITLGNIIDRLIIQKLKLAHKSPDEEEHIQILERQIAQLQKDIDNFINLVITGQIPPEEIKMPQCKVYKKEGNESITSTEHKNMGELINNLIDINKKMWGNQDLIYKFEEVPIDERPEIIKRLAIYNLDRNKLIDAIDSKLYEEIKSWKN